jgi:hypothetical protein
MPHRCDYRSDAKRETVADMRVIEIKPVHVTFTGSGNFGDGTLRFRGQTPAWA